MKFTDEQLRFIESDAKRLILDAPAGTGKTETIAERVRRSVEAGKNVLLTCFTHSSRKTLQKRLNEAGLSHITVRTVGSLAHELLVEEYGNIFLVGDGSDIAREVCSGTAVRPKNLTQFEALTVNGAPLPDSLPPITASVYEEYEKKKEEIGYLSHLDVILAATGMRDYGYDEIYIDEAQDLAPIQWRMLLSFGGKKYIFAGDPGQAIYGFSGVDVELLPRLIADGWEKISLTRSFRVPSALLPVVNLNRETPMSSIRDGGSVQLIEEDYRKLPETLSMMLKKGDAVLSWNQNALSKIIGYMKIYRAGVPMTFSWNEKELKDDAVHFSTIHSAKGGEWNRVFLVGLEEDGFSSHWEKVEAEQKRLFYVGATRAKDELVLCQTGEELPWGLKL